MDRVAIEELGVPGVVLMENAGAAVAREVMALCRHTDLRRVHVLCGTGNNGGDGFVAARNLLLSGHGVTYEIVGDPERIQGDALTNLRILRSLGLEPSSRSGEAVLVDALLGTGSSGAPRGAIAQAIREIRASGLPVVAVDVPSGVDADSGAVPGEVVRADVTVTFGYPKPGLLLYPGAAFAGRVVVDAIGMDWSRTGVPTCCRWYGMTDARVALPRRPRDAHKGAFGHVLIIGGSAGMSGAPSLAARGALRSGAGLVTVATPRSVQPIVAANIPEAMTVPLAEDHGTLAAESMDGLAASIERATVCCLGPGLGRTSQAAAFARQFVAQCTLPLVMDADGLWAIGGQEAIVRSRHAPTVMTPHPGECAHLLGTDTATVQSNRLSAARQLADRYGCTAILKGAGTVICHSTASPQQDSCTIVTTGNPGMATGGSGDVLTGVVGSLLAQGLPPYEAACLAAFVHGLAGDIARNCRGEHGLVAGDIAERLADALKELGE